MSHFFVFLLLRLPAMMRVMLMVVVVVVVNMMGVRAGAHRIPRRIRNCSSTIAQFLEKKNYPEIMFAAVDLILETNDRIKIMQKMTECDHCIDCDCHIWSQTSKECSDNNSP